MNIIYSLLVDYIVNLRLLLWAVKFKDASLNKILIRRDRVIINIIIILILFFYVIFIILYYYIILKLLLLLLLITITNIISFLASSLTKIVMTLGNHSLLTLT